MNVSCRIRVVLPCALAALFLIPSTAFASDGDVPPSTPPTQLQVWHVNIESLREDWELFITRMQLNQFAPDIVTVNQLSLNEVSLFMGQMDAVFGTNRYAIVHSDSQGTLGPGEAGHNAVIYDTARFSRTDSGTYWKALVGTSCSGAGKRQIAVALQDKLHPDLDRGIRHVLVAAMHIPGDLSENCVGRNAERADEILENKMGRRDMSIIAGDFNQRPDFPEAVDLSIDDPLPPIQPAHHGMEADPDCWYRGFSAGHLDVRTTDPLEATCPDRSNRYYDTVWLHPSGGNASNPSASICEQWTFAFFRQQPLEERLNNTSCTDVDLDGKLDNARFDYIWVGWEFANGDPFTPPLGTAAPLVEFASVDHSAQIPPVGGYSEHRAVQALLNWPESP